MVNTHHNNVLSTFCRLGQALLMSAIMTFIEKNTKLTEKTQDDISSFSRLIDDGKGECLSHFCHHSEYLVDWMASTFQLPFSQWPN